MLAYMRDAGVVERTFQRAKRELGAVSRRDGGGIGSRLIMDLPGSRERELS